MATDVLITIKSEAEGFISYLHHPDERPSTQLFKGENPCGGLGDGRHDIAISGTVLKPNATIEINVATDVNDINLGVRIDKHGMISASVPFFLLDGRVE